ncbi:MAG TPA: autotransporter-associated beta strand repeat-containing protein [Rariglobus sp.]|jgi:autotransporter-associated beta strand protein|nr:autotransporter-associated beta strand repeat-containing protein [Rariglobus sp.]
MNCSFDLRKSSVSPAFRLIGVLVATCALNLGHFAWAANSSANFNTAATDLSVGTNYTPNITPTSATTTDAQFTGSYSGGLTFTVNGSALSFGTLNDADTTQSLIISNDNATAGSIQLNTAANSLSGTAGDLLWVKSGANLTLQSGTGTLTLILAASGNIDTAGILTLAGPVSIGAGTTTTFTGNGTTNVSGNIAATTGAITINNGTGTVNLSGTNSNTGLTTLTAGKLVISGNQTAATGGLTLNGGTLDLRSTTALGAGTFNINGGTIINGSGSALAAQSNAAPITFSNNFTLGASGNTGGNGDINFGTGAVSVTGSRTITLNGTGSTFTFGGAAANTTTGGVTTTVNGVGNTLVYTGTYTLGGNNGNASSTFNGTGNVSLLGAVQNFTATTQTLSYSGSGTLTMGAANTYTGNTFLNSGTLSLDFSQAAAPVTNIINNSANSSSLYDNGTLIIKGASGASNSQHFPNFYTELGNNAVITVNQNGATAVNLDMGILHRIGKSTMTLTLPTTGSISTTGAGVTGVVNFAAAGGGSTWATYNATTGAFGALSTYATGTGNYIAASDVDVTNGDSVSGVTVNSLRLNSAGETLTLSGNNKIAAGILVTPTATGTTTINGGGAVTANNAANELTVLNYGGTTDLTGIVIADNGSNSTSLTLGGTGTTYLGTGNTYTGVTTVTGGTLSLNGSNLAIGSLGGGGNATINLTGNTLTINNTPVTTAMYSGLLSGTAGSAINKTGTGAQYFNNVTGAGQTFSGTVTVTSGFLETFNQIGANSNTFVVGGGSSNTATLYLSGSQGVAIKADGSGTGALTLIGNGFLQSSTGTTITFVNNPTLTLSSFGYDPLGRNVNGGQLSEKGGVTGTGNLLINAGGAGTGGALQSYATAINNTGTVTIMSLGTGTNGASLAGGGGVNIGNGGTNAGFGANVSAIFQAANGGGLTDYMPNNDTGFVGTIYTVAGTFSADASQANAGTSGIASGNGMLNSAVNLVQGGGTFQFKGTNTGSFKVQNQILNGLTLNAGASTIDVLNPGGASNSTTLDLRGAGGTTNVTRNVGGTVNFTASTGTFGTTSVIKVHNSNDAGGILGGWATVSGTGWAINNGSDVVATLGSYGTLGASTSTTNVDYGATAAQSASGLAANTLRFNNAVAGVLTLSGTNILTDGGILVTSNVGNNLTTITGGTLEGSASGDLIVNQFNTSNALTISSLIADNTGATALTKSGTGTLNLTNASNSYSGGTFVNAGILNVNGGATVLGSGPLVMNGGTLQNTSSTALTIGNYTLTTAGGGFDASGTGSGGLTVNGTMTVTGATAADKTNGYVSEGGAQNLNLSGTGTGTAGGVYNGVISNGALPGGSNQVNYTAVNKTGAGTWTLTNANTYTGFTTITAGTLVAANVSALGNLNGTNVFNPALVVMNGGTLDIATDTSINPYNIEVNATSTIVSDRATSGAGITQQLGTLKWNTNGGGGSGAITINSGTNDTSAGFVSFGAAVLGNGGASLTAGTANVSLASLSSAATTGNTFTLTLGSTITTGLNTIQGEASDGILGGALAITRNGGNGTWVLAGADSYTGATTITTGALRITNNSALGTGLGTSTSGVSVASGGALQLQGGITTTTAVPLNINGAGVSGAANGALENVSGNNTYTGLITLGGSGITIGSDTAGDTLTLSNTGTITTTSTGNLTVMGAGNTVINGNISTGSATLTKNGSGILTLNGANSFTGATALTAGTLLINGSITSVVTASNTGTVFGGSGSSNTAVTLNANTTFAAGGVGAVGTFTTTGLTTLNSATFAVDFNSTLGTFDKLVTNGITLSSASLSLTDIGSGGGFTIGQFFKIVDNTSGSSISSTFLGQTEGSTITSGNTTFTISYAGGDGNDITLTVLTTAVPEPATYAAIFGALALGGALLRRRRLADKSV